MIKLKDILYEIFDRYWTLETAKPIADALKAKIVGSVALKGSSNHDLDLRIEHDDILSVTKILNKLGFESYGSQVVSPEEVKKSKKQYGKGWQRSYCFINQNDKIIQIWMDEKENLAEIFEKADYDWIVGKRYDASDVLIYVQNIHNAGFGESGADEDRFFGYFECLYMNPKQLPKSPYMINDAWVNELSKSEEEFPPIVITKDLYIIDGGHRLAASIKRGDKEIKVLKQI